MQHIHSLPYRLDESAACERCCFGSGEHAPWCATPGEPTLYERMQRLWAEEFRGIFASMQARGESADAAPQGGTQ